MEFDRHMHLTTWSLPSQKQFEEVMGSLEGRASLEEVHNLGKTLRV